MESIMGFMIIWLVYMLFALALSVAFYVLQSLGLYTVAKRRQINKPWLAWLPVGNMWILGCISDQYQYVGKGAVRNKRKGLLGMTIAMYILMCVFFVFYFLFLFRMIVEEALYTGAMMHLAGMGLSMVVLAVLSVAAIVIEYMALYDYFRSCEPDSATLFLILSIFVSVVLPVFVFAVRNKDLGMPPRKPIQPVYEQPTYQQPIDEQSPEA